MERGNSKHSPREDDMLAADLNGSLGIHGSNREEWVDPEPPADDDAPERTGPPVEELPINNPDDAGAQEDQAQHDLNVANDWHDTEA